MPSKAADVQDENDGCSHTSSCKTLMMPTRATDIQDENDGCSHAFSYKRGGVLMKKTNIISSGATGIQDENSKFSREFSHKKVAFLIDSLHGGGAERVVSNLTLHLREDTERYIITFSCNEATYPYKGTHLTLKPCLDGKPNWLRKLYLFVTYITQLRAIKRQYAIPICVSFLPIPNLLNIVSGNSGKTIVSIRNYISKRNLLLKDRFYNSFFRLLHNRADLIVAVSMGVKEDLTNTYGISRNKIVVIYNPYDIEQIKRSGDETLVGSFQGTFNKPVIITVGSLTGQKGHHHLIRAFKKVKEHHRDAKLMILGKGDLEDRLRRLALDCDLEDDVLFPGFQDNPFMFIQRSSLFILPSLYEGFPNALVEAMVCGTPVIAADCRSGPREILAPETDSNKETKSIEFAPYGVLVPVCDGIERNATDPLTPEEEMMAESMITLLNDQELRENYARMARERADDFGLEKIIYMWEEIL